MSAVEPVFTQDQFNRLRIGEVVTSAGVFQGVCDKPLQWRLLHMNKKKTVAEFSAYYFDVFFGDFKVTLHKKKSPVVTPL